MRSAEAPSASAFTTEMMVRGKEVGPQAALGPSRWAVPRLSSLGWAAGLEARESLGWSKGVYPEAGPSFQDQRLHQVHKPTMLLMTQKIV